MALRLTYLDNFLYRVSQATQDYVIKLKIRHCLCSNMIFSKRLQEEEKETYDGIEWAQSRIGKVVKGKLVLPIHGSGHILSCVFIPVFGGLSIRTRDRIYYFNGERFEDRGYKVPLYLPLELLSENLQLSIDLEEYEGEEIPLTFFYMNLNSDMRISLLPKDYPPFSIPDTVRNHGPRVELKELLYRLDSSLRLVREGDLTQRLLFLTKGRFNERPYLKYIEGEVETSSLGNYQLVMLYTSAKNTMCKLLARKLAVFQILD